MSSTIHSRLKSLKDSLGYKLFSSVKEEEPGFFVLKPLETQRFEQYNGDEDHWFGAYVDPITKNLTEAFKKEFGAECTLEILGVADNGLVEVEVAENV